MLIKSPKKWGGRTQVQFLGIGRTKVHSVTGRSRSNISPFHIPPFCHCDLVRAGVAGRFSPALCRPPCDWTESEAERACEGGREVRWGRGGQPCRGDGADEVDGVCNVCKPFLTSVLRKSLLCLKQVVHHESARTQLQYNLL